MKKLTISQALRRRKKLKGDISTFVRRLQEALVYDKEKPPAFGFEETSTALSNARFELIFLEDAVARANANTTLVFQGVPVYLTWVLRTLAELKADLHRYEGYEYTCLPERENVTKTEAPDLSQAIEQTNSVSGQITRSHPIKVRTETRICNITTKECALKMEQLQSEFNELNDLLETANHTTVIEYQDQSVEDKKNGEAPPAP